MFHVNIFYACFLLSFWLLLLSHVASAAPRGSLFSGQQFQVMFTSWTGLNATGADRGKRALKHGRHQEEVRESKKVREKKPEKSFECSGLGQQEDDGSDQTANWTSRFLPEFSKCISNISRWHHSKKVLHTTTRVFTYSGWLNLHSRWAKLWL